MKAKLIIGSIVTVFILALMFLGPREELTLKSYIMHCVMPALTVIVFWINYLWILPQYVFIKKSKKAIFYNLFIMVAFCSFLVYWHDIEFKYERQKDFHEEMERQEQPTPPMEMADVPPPDAIDSHTINDGMDMPPVEAMPMPPAGQHNNAYHHERHDNEERHDKPHRGPEHLKKFNVTAALRDSINFLFAIFVAFTLRSERHITQLKEQRQEAEMARRDAELRSLRNQISPHFLLNTLNNIYALAGIDGKRTQDAVMQLSKMLRHMLYDNQSEMVTLKSEVDFIRSYVDLMKLRLASNVTVNTEFNIDETKNTLVSPLLYISLVENAFKHGVSSTEPCVINITLKENDKRIICNISNSNHPKQSNDRSGHGVGLELVEQRLKMVYPNCYSWEKGVEADGLYHSSILIEKVES